MRRAGLSASDELFCYHREANVVTWGEVRTVLPWGEVSMERNDCGAKSP